MKNSKVLISGGKGFVGSHLVDYLIDQGFRVNVLDDVHHGHGHVNPEAVYFQGTILDDKIIDRAIDGCDFVVHLAALISVENSLLEPSRYLQNNVLGTNKVFEACQKNKIRVVYASSSAVYGEGKYYFPDLNGFNYPHNRFLDHYDFFFVQGEERKGVKMPSTEQDLLQPTSVYAATKALNEQAAQSLDNSCGLRFANIYGPGQNVLYAGFIKKMVDCAKNKTTLEIFEDGYQMRNFIHVKNVVEAIYKIMLSSRQGIYNIGFPESTEVLNLVLSFQRELKKINLNLEYKISYLLRPGDVRHSVLCIDKFQTDFGTLNYIPLEVGIFELLDTYI